MVKSPRNRDPGVGPERGSTTGMPRWVWVVGIIVIVVVLLVVAVLLLSGGLGGHGPSRHTSSGAHTPPASVAATVLAR
jgi:preprotein translocase subunit SecG